MQVTTICKLYDILNVSPLVSFRCSPGFNLIYGQESLNPGSTRISLIHAMNRKPGQCYLSMQVVNNNSTIWKSRKKARKILNHISLYCLRCNFMKVLMRIPVMTGLRLLHSPRRKVQ